ncbi:TetR/AcrR family transcriptional regulator [Luteipulveratus mongoliensis]|uniref:HTH tetR-type domain-containing protein n=1 Tax=Luteipulveratus mongoliensis TaxID=571913 RepID=A0A0K1JFK3_9MICO|nr:TetR/AcrR family transcriptional regulator [Luteipulveratus mongoliensis]AKU15370.1 hypothetical protein VV02_04975 [Luteipulveratus mongoliensis]
MKSQKSSEERPTRPRGRPRAFDEDKAVYAAAQLFWQHGYDGTSISELTAAMGITTQSLYSAFGSKAELYQRSLISYRENSGGGLPAALALPNAVDAMVGVMENAARQFTRRGLPHGCMISTGCLQVSAEHTELAEHLRGIRRTGRRSVEDRLRRGVAEGDLRPDIDVPSLARYVQVMAQGIAVQATDGASTAALRAVVKQASITVEAARAD